MLCIFKVLFNQEHLEEYLTKHKIPKFRKKQILHAIFKDGILDIDEISTLSKDLREKMKKEFCISHLKQVEKVESDETTKFLFELPT